MSYDTCMSGGKMPMVLACRMGTKSRADYLCLTGTLAHLLSSAAEIVACCDITVTCELLNPMMGKGAVLGHVSVE